MSGTTDDYTGDLLVPGPETRAKLAELLERRARLNEEIAFVQNEIVMLVPDGFEAADGCSGLACCGSPIIGWTAKSLEKDSSPPFFLHTATLKHPGGCCSVDDAYPTEDEAWEAAWKLAQANALIWKHEVAK